MKKFNFLSALVVCLAMVGAAAFTSCGGGADTPGGIEMSIWKQMENGNYEKAIESFFVHSTSSFESSPEEVEQMKSMYAPLGEKIRQEYDAKGGLKKVELLTEMISEEADAAQTVVELTFGDGSTEEEGNDYVRIDGKWWIEQ